MCKKCVKSPYPDRDRMCLEQGAFLANLGGCGECSKKDLIVGDKSEEEVEGQETVTYKHICLTCQHVISEHKYEFWVEDGRQEYRMDCLLCGTAEDSLSVGPYDPMKAKGEY